MVEEGEEEPGVMEEPGLMEANSIGIALRSKLTRLNTGWSEADAVRRRSR